MRRRVRKLESEAVRISCRQTGYAPIARHPELVEGWIVVPDAYASFDKLRIKLSMTLGPYSTRGIDKEQPQTASRHGNLSQQKRDLLFQEVPLNTGPTAN